MAVVESLGKDDVVVVTLDDWTEEPIEEGTLRTRVAKLEGLLAFERELNADSNRAYSDEHRIRQAVEELKDTYAKKMFEYERFVNESGLRGAFEEFLKRKEEERLAVIAREEAERKAAADRARGEYISSNPTAQSILAEMRRRRGQGN